MRKVKTLWPVFVIIVCGLTMAPLRAMPLYERLGGTQYMAPPQQTNPLFLKIISLDLDHSLAAVKWLESLVFYGDRVLKETFTGADVDWLWRSLQSQLILDPNTLDTYVLAAGVFPFAPKRPEYSLQLLLYGATQRSTDWRIYFALGYHLSSHFGDKKNATLAWKIASELQGRPDWLPSLTAMNLVEGQDYDTALRFLEAMASSDTNSDSPYLAEMQTMQQAIKGMKKLQQYADVLRQRLKRPLDSLQDLVRYRMLRAVPVDPYGDPYQWDVSSQSVTTKTRLVPLAGDRKTRKLLPAWLRPKVAQNLLDKQWALMP